MKLGPISCFFFFFFSGLGAVVRFQRLRDSASYANSKHCLRYHSSNHCHNWLRHSSQKLSANGQCFLGALMAVCL